MRFRPFCVRLGALVFALAVAGPVLTADGAWAQGAFYDATAAEIAGTPGTVIRAEAMAGAPLGAGAWRVLYRTTGLKGETIAASGVVIVPRDEPPAEGRPIVAWAHPTSGIIAKCGPSTTLLFFQTVMGLRDMVERGFVVVAPDYPGLGTPEPHPYLVGVSEGRSVLDLVRAARTLEGADTSDQVALWGHSQGGQAVLYAVDIAKEYAPDLKIVGVAAAAPATELGKLMEDDLHTSGGKNLLAMTLWSWNRVFDAPIDQVVEADALPAVDRLASICLDSLLDILPRQQVGKDLDKSFLKVDDITQLEPWKSLLAENTIGTLPPDIPVFIAQGTADETVDPPVTSAYVAALCKAGSKVEAVAMDGVGHATAALRSADSAVAWIADRFAGNPPPSDCP